MTDSSRVQGLDTLRGFAALAVVFAHVVLFGGLPTPRLGVLAALATIAVELFFILSAFSLCLAYLGRLDSMDDVGHFYKRRAFRILPLFYLMLVLWLLAGRQDFDLATLAANVTFTFPLVPGMHESMVPAGWSLGTEMVFYAFFPAMLVIIRSLRASLIALFVTTVFAALISGWLMINIPEPNSVAPFSRTTILTRLPFFVAGMTLFFMYAKLRHASSAKRKMLSGALWLAAALYYILLVINAALLPDFQQFFFRYLFAAGFLPVVLASSVYAPRWFTNRAFLWLGGISYGVYLMHPLVMLVTRRLRIDNFSPDTVGSAWASFLLSFATVALLATAAASLSYLFMERPFQRLARRPREPEAFPAPPVSTTA